jgi:hypothetical protein
MSGELLVPGCRYRPPGGGVVLEAVLEWISDINEETGYPIARAVR